MNWKSLVARPGWYIPNPAVPLCGVAGFFCGIDFGYGLKNMSSTQETNKEAARERVLVFLSFFTSPESQRAFAPTMPEENLAYELCDIWFDKVFVAGMRYLDGIRGDWNEAEASAFRESFTDEEWKYLERFHRFLELRIDMMSSVHKAQRTIPHNNLWESVVRDAHYLYELLEPDLRKRALIGESLSRGLIEGSNSLFQLERPDTN